MASMVQHKMWGFVFSSPFLLLGDWGYIPFLIFGIIFSYHSVLPDLRGIAHGSIDGNFDSYVDSHRSFGEYYKAHQYNPFYRFHIFIDDYICTHDIGKRWWVWNERMWAEVLLDALILLYFCCVLSSCLMLVVSLFYSMAFLIIFYLQYSHEG